MRSAAVASAIAVTILLLFGTAAWFALHFVPIDFSYGVETDFVEVPTSDAELQKWLQGQPGVWKAWVERQRVEPRWRILVTIGMTQNGWRDPPFPDLAGKCAELGYRGQQRPFQDQPR